MAEQLLASFSEESKRILGYIQTFVGSQGTYGRLLHDLMENPDSAEEWLSQYHHCTDLLDFVMEFEGG